MNRLLVISLLVLVLLPLLCLLISLSTRNLGFFFYSLPGALAPGLTGYFISKSKKQ